MTESLKEAIKILKQIEEDITISKNIRTKIKLAFIALEEETIDLPIRINKSLQELEELSEDPNIPSYTRTQIWNVASLLETIK